MSPVEYTDESPDAEQPERLPIATMSRSGRGEHVPRRRLFRAMDSRVSDAGGYGKW